MRWDELFGDLESQWVAEERRELDAEVADRTRRERARLGLLDRLAGAADAELVFHLRDGSRFAGLVADAGDGWVLVAPSRGPAGGSGGEAAASAGAGAALVPFVAVVGVAGLPARAGTPGLGRSFGLGYALRGLSRDRSVVKMTDLSGSVSTGTIDAVGSDVLELAEHPADLPRRAENITGRRLVPFSALVLIRPA